jgi:hypothetical protein
MTADITQHKLNAEALDQLRSDLQKEGWQHAALLTEILDNKDQKVLSLYTSGPKYAVMTRVYGEGGIRLEAPLKEPATIEFGSGIEVCQKYPAVWQAYLIALETNKGIEKTIMDAEEKGVVPVINTTQLREQARQKLEKQAYKPEQ